MVDIPDKNLLEPGHRGCAGCGASIAVKLALNALGENTVAISATGCLEVMTTPYPETAWEVPFIHVAFENSGAVASGVESALRIQGKEDVNVIAFGGDGGTVDIGLQSLSGAMERGHNMTYICYDNEAYTSFGEDKPKKNMPMIMAAHGIPYVATASIAFPEDYVKKVKKAAETKGPAYIHLQQPCTTGWGFSSEKTIEMGRLAVETGSWILYEIVDGKFEITYRPEERKPVKEYLAPQKRFRHLNDEIIDKIQKYVDAECDELGL